MGILGLQKFIKDHCEDVFEPINILESAELYKNETGEIPVMLVDISSCILHLTPFNGRNPLVGRSIKKLKKNLEILINNCWSAGIKILVINDGMKSNEKFKSWLENCERFTKNLEKFYYEHKVTNYKSWRRFDFGVLLTAAINVFHSTDKCECRRAIFESDDYILDYFNKFKCFAVLTGDSDFIIAEGVRYCICIKNLNLHSMTSFSYNRNNLANFFGIAPSHLPLFGLLCNEVLKIPKLKNDWNNRFFKVAKLLQDFSSEVENPQFLEKYLGFSSNISYVIQEKLKRYYGDGKIAIKYTKYENWNNILNLAKIRHSRDVSHKNVLEILSERQVYFSPLWANILQSNSVCALKNFRKKIYELLFYEYPKTDEVFITEHFFKKDEPYGRIKHCADRVKVEFTSYSHSGLCKLWLENSSDEILEEKQKIFCKTFNENLNWSDLRPKDISEDLIFPLLATFYLLWEVKKNIEGFEVKTLLIQAVLTKHLSAADVDKYEDEFECDSFDLSEWFIRVIDHLRVLNNVCGEPFSVRQTNLINYFDLKLLHTIYKKAKKQLISPTMWSSNIWSEYERLNEKLYELGAKCGYVGQL